MSALLAIGLALLVVGVVRTAGELGRSEPADAGFGEVDLALPAGARLRTVSADQGRLYLHIETSEGGQAILVVDAVDGRLLGRIRLGAAP